ncbi:MAG: flagellar motor switch protein FliG [Planctomycetota bacterium]|jgi:flagellar motor switch protein FliG
MVTKRDALSEAKQIAILLLSIDQDLSAQVLRHLPDETVERVTRAMKELQEIAVDHQTVAATMKQAIRRIRKGDMVLGDVSGSAEDVLVKAFGEARAQNVANKAGQDILTRRPFAVFESLPGPDLARRLIEAHPQLAAGLLADLDKAKAGDVLAHFPEEQRSDLIYRVATLDRTPPDVVQRVLEVMRVKVKNLGLTTVRAEPKAWVQAAARILNHLGGGEKVILEGVGEVNEETANAIRDEMFTFDDIATLDRRSMQKILSQIDTRILAIALKAAPAPVEDTIFSNLSKRAGGMVAEERDTLGPMPLSEVLEAQQQILIVIRDMMDKGDIRPGGIGEEMV